MARLVQRRQRQAVPAQRGEDLLVPVEIELTEEDADSEPVVPAEEAVATSQRLPQSAPAREPSAMSAKPAGASTGAPTGDLNLAYIPVAALQDERLSFRARGVLAYLASLPPEKVRTGDLGAKGREGRGACRTAVKELEALGYLSQSRGKYLTEARRVAWMTVTALHTSPLQTGFEDPGNPAAENRSLGGSSQAV